MLYQACRVTRYRGRVPHLSGVADDPKRHGPAEQHHSDIHLTQALKESVRQEHQNDINAIVEELNGLLPHLSIQVGVNFHALAHKEVMRLTVYARDDSLDVNALEILRQHLEEHQRMFISLLADPAEAV